jgi:hypothetical protein
MKKLLNAPVHPRLAFTVYLAFIVFGVILISAMSCVTAKKCADKYPVKQTVEYIPGTTLYDTIYIPGDTIVFSDTIRVHCDSAGQVIEKVIYKEGQCLPTQKVTVIRVDTVAIVVENTARVEAEKGRADRAEGRLSAAIDDKGAWQQRAFIAWGILALIAGVAIISKIKGIV